MSVKSQTIIGERVTCEPLNPDHLDGLTKAANDERIWAYTIIDVVGKGFGLWFDKALEAQQNDDRSLIYAIRDKQTGELVGSSRFYEYDAKHQRAAIGYTWLNPSVWGTGVNDSLKHAMLQFGFDDLNLNRIAFYIDDRNGRSRRALLKLGAKEEGLLRQHMVLPDGFVRDTAVFSIISSEWRA